MHKIIVIGIVHLWRQIAKPPRVCRHNYTDILIVCMSSDYNTCIFVLFMNNDFFDNFLDHQVMLQVFLLDLPPHCRPELLEMTLGATSAVM